MLSVLAVVELLILSPLLPPLSAAFAPILPGSYKHDRVAEYVAFLCDNYSDDGEAGKSVSYKPCSV